MKDKHGYDYWRAHGESAIAELQKEEPERFNQLIEDRELHDDIYNPCDYIMIYTDRCWEFLESPYNMSQCIDIILQWEFENFGNLEEEVKELKEKPYYHRDKKDSLIFRLWDMVEVLSSVEKLVARYAYIIGEEIIYNDLEIKPVQELEE